MNFFSFLGKGAFATVYSCRKPFSRKKFAAKVVEHGNDNRNKIQMENEIQVSFISTQFHMHLDYYDPDFQ